MRKVLCFNSANDIGMSSNKNHVDFILVKAAPVPTCSYSRGKVPKYQKVRDCTVVLLAVLVVLLVVLVVLVILLVVFVVLLVTVVLLQYL